MPHTPHTAPDPGGLPVIFRCPSCDLKLSISGKQAGINGPCPSCGTIIRAPVAEDSSSGIPAISDATTPKIYKAGSGFSERSIRQKGRISADTIVDQEQLDRKETAKTLGIITMFLLAFAACLAVAWFLQDWIGK